VKVRNGKPGRPKKVEDDPRLEPLLDEIDKAEAEVLAAVRAHIAAPTQKNAVRMCDAQLVVATLRAHLARQARDDDAAARESALVIKLAAARDDAVARMWGDELDRIHEMVTKVGGLQAAIAAELAAETEDEEKEENP
jgi:hypothetical protein